MRVFGKSRCLAQAYQRFLVQLSNEAVKNKIPLRIILEPSVPFSAITWPEGPEYVVMLYNLYGNHTTTGGPKANKSLIAKTILAMGNLPGARGVALGYRRLQLGEWCQGASDYVRRKL
jgi:spore germination protein